MHGELRFAFKLAVRLGKTLKELLTGEPGMFPSELAYWLAYDRIDPFGEDRADLRSGILAATVANCHRSRNADSFKAADFMPDFRTPEERAVPVQSPDEVLDALVRYFGPPVPPPTSAARPSTPTG